MSFLRSYTILWLVAALAYGIWVVMGFFAEDILEDTVQAVFFLNLPLLIALVLFLVDALAVPFLSAGLRDFIELFFLPAGTRYYNDYHFTDIPFPLLQVIGAALLLSASLAGCQARRYGRP